MSLFLVFLHILFMFSAVAISYGPLTIVTLALRGGRTETLRAVTSGAKTLAVAIPILYVIGGALGLVAAISSSVNLLAGWLVIAYILFAFLMGIGATLIGPWIERLATASAAAPDGPFSAEINVISADPRMRIVRVVDLVLVIGILYDMVVKPIS